MLVNRLHHLLRFGFPCVLDALFPLIVGQSMTFIIVGIKPIKPKIMILISGLFVAMAMISKRIGRAYGAVLVGCYVLYMVYVALTRSI